MRDSEIAGHLASARRRLDFLEQRFREARAKLHDRAGIGYPRTSMGGGGGPSGGHSDPVARAAADALERAERDRYEAEYHALGHHAKHADRHLENAENIVTAAVVTSSVPGVPGCAACGAVTLRGLAHDCDQACRDRDHKHPNGWQEIYKRIPSPEDPTGADVPYCTWHARFVENYGVEPERAIVIWHLDHLGSKVPHALIRDRHPVEFADYEARRRSVTEGRPSFSRFAL